MQSQQWSKLMVTKTVTRTPTCTSIWNRSHRHSTLVAYIDTHQWSVNKCAYPADFFNNKLETQLGFWFSADNARHMQVFRLTRYTTFIAAVFYAGIEYRLPPFYARIEWITSLPKPSARSTISTDLILMPNNFIILINL